MQLELKIAPTTLQRAMEIILPSGKWQSALAYLDHIVVVPKTVEQHFNHLQRVLTIVQDAGLIIKLKTCSFFAETIDYPGHVISLRKLERT